MFKDKKNVNLTGNVIKIQLDGKNRIKSTESTEQAKLISESFSLKFYKYQNFLRKSQTVFK